MDLKKLSLASLVGAVVMFFSGYLVWGLGLESILRDHMTHYDGLVKEMPDFSIMIVSMLVSAFMFAYIFDHWAGIRTFMTGAKAGALLMVLIGLSQELFQLSYFNLNDGTSVAINLVANALYGAISGGVIGWVLGKFHK